MRSLSPRNVAWSFPFIALALAAPDGLLAGDQSGVHDLSLLVAPDVPCVWPSGMTQFARVPARTFGASPFYREMLIIDEHTGTQFDAPAHFTPPPDSGLPGAGPMGLVTGEKVPVWQFVGEACVIDIRSHVDEGERGSSYLITPDIVRDWEQQNRPVGPGDVVLFRSDYSDKYYHPFPAGDRAVATVLQKKTPGWPAPTPECIQYLGERKVAALGIDSPSMGPVPDLAAATHQMGSRYGIIWTEFGTNYGKLPTTGSAYVLLPAKHAGGSGAESRAIGITEPKLAARIIRAAREKKVIDLSVTLDENYPVVWPGTGPGDEANRYISKVLNAFNKARGPYFAMAHVMDSQVGTHVVAPAYALPPAGFDNARYSPEVREALAEFEKKSGPRGTSDMTVEKVPLEQLIGEAYVIDVKKTLGTASTKKGPASPLITLELIKDHEQKTRPVAAGDVVIFHSGYSDQHLKPLPASPELDRLMAAPLAGQAEGWPAPTPEVVAYLAEKGVRCIATDGPSLGGTDPKNAMPVYWTAAGKGVQVVEFLQNVSKVPASGALFLFAPIKIEGAHGGYGRAIAVY